MQNLPEKTVDQARFEAAKDKLREAVVAPDAVRPSCALARLRQQMADGRNLDNTEAAARIGFTHAEAWGIMGGWDDMTGRVCLYKRYGGMYTRLDAVQRERGEKLGREMYQAAKEKGLL